MDHLPLRLGLTMWSHNHWQQTFYGRGTKNQQRLEKYAQVFHTVEGNTTFYATPTLNTVKNWAASVGEQFRFTFKLPQAITHQRMLKNCHSELNDFINIMSPLHELIGQWSIQLPASFGPEHFDRLVYFCTLFPKDFNLGIEVRHPEFFRKGDAEKRLNHWLIEHEYNRTIIDSRPIFSAEPNSESIIDAQKKKPKVPVHAISTAQRPMIRFIGHPEVNENMPFFEPWVSKLADWIEQGKQPYFMVHTSDNLVAPDLALLLYNRLKNHTNLPDLATFPANNDHGQISIF